ncbi:MAG: hypothetical protein SNG35_08325 [Rikenellaceae bacterium]
MKRLFLSYGSKAVLAMMVGVATLTTGCRISDAEVAPVPQDAVNPLDAKAFYVVGRVIDQNGAGVASVPVKVVSGSASATTNSSGYYELTIDAEKVSEANAALSGGLNFTIPTGYVGQAYVAAQFPNSETSYGATLTINHSISKANTGTSIDVSVPTTFYITSSSMGVNYVANAVAVTLPANVTTTSPVTFSGTLFIPSVVEEVLVMNAGDYITDYYTPSTATNMEFTYASVNTSKEIDVKVPLESAKLISRSGSTYYFSDVRWMLYDGISSWNHIKDISFNSEYYTFSVDNNYLASANSAAVGVAPKTNIAIVVESINENGRLLSTEVIDNYNNTEVLTHNYTYSKCSNLVFDSFTINDADAASTNPVVLSELMGYLETMVGVSHNDDMVTMDQTAVLSGDTKVTVTYRQDYKKYQVTADVTDGVNTYKAIYRAVYYGVVNRTVVTEYGNLRYYHNF